MILARSLAAACVLFASLSVQAADSEPIVVKIGTLAPRESPWGQVFRVWQKAVKERTGGAVDLQFFWNGTQGDEGAMVAKMKTGQLDGAAITATGLGLIHRDTTVLQMPGVFTSWERLDTVRNALSPKFEAAFKAAGFVFVGWGDVGFDRYFAKGFAAKAPADFKGKRPWAWREDPIVPTTYQTIGDVVAVPTGVPEVLPELTTGNINSIQCAALVAEQLQWASRLDHMTPMLVSPSIGAIMLTSAKIDSLPPNLRNAVVETGKVAARALTDRIRKEDNDAANRLRKRMTVDEPTAADLEQWAKVYKEVRVRLAKGTFRPELVKQVEDLASRAK